MTDAPTRIPTPEPGVYENIPFDTYLAWDAADASAMKDMAHSPAYCHYKRIQPEEDKSYFVKGRLFHLLISDEKAADDEFIIKPETYPAIAKPEGSEWTVKCISDDGCYYQIAKGRGKAKVAHMAQIVPGGVEYIVESDAPADSLEFQMKPWNGNARFCKHWGETRHKLGRTLIDADTFADCQGMAESVRSHPKLGPLVKDAQVELSVVWIDPITGIKCKARYDLFKNGIIVDAKSTSRRAWSANVFANPFFQEANKHGYHIQCGMYVDSLKALAKELAIEKGDVPWFVFAAVEGYAPYLIMDYDVYDHPDALSRDFLEYGRVIYRTLLQEYKNCMESGQWPGYPTEHEDMMLTYSALKDYEERTQQLTG